MKAEMTKQPESSHFMKTNQQTRRINTRLVISVRNKLCFRIPAALTLAALLAMALPAGATYYTWTNSLGGNWSAPTSWNPNTPSGGPTGGDVTVFNNSGASGSPATVNNTVDQNFKVMSFTNGSSSGGSSYSIYHVAQIPSGNTLTVTNLMVIGGLNLAAATPDPDATYEYMFGAGTLYVTATNLIVQDYGSAAGANACAYLNLSGLTNFIYNNKNGSFSMSGFLPSNYSGNSPYNGTRQGGSIILAAGSNNITASAINLGTSQANQAGPSGLLASGVPNQLTLGPGTNIINASTITISAFKNPIIVTNSGGGLRIRGVTGADSDANVNITIGLRNTGGTGTTAGQLLLDGCAVDIKAGTITIGENTGGAPTTAADSGSGTLQFDTGTVSANSMLMAYNSSANNGANQAQCNGTIQVGSNGTLLIGAGQLFALATATASGPSTGILIVSNGYVNCQGPITMGAHVGTTSGTIQLISAGKLSMGPNSYIGALSNAVTSLIVDTNSTLSLSIPSITYTNICVGNLTWPAVDTNLTISVAAIPAGITNGAVCPFLNYSGSFSGGPYSSPILSLPPGIVGNLSLSGQTIFVNITAGAGLGQGGQEELLNPLFALSPAGTNWTPSGNAYVVSTNSTYPNTSVCASDTHNVQGFIGPNVAELTSGPAPSTNTWSQSVPMAAGTLLTAGGDTYVAHENILSSDESFYYEVDFQDTNGNLLAAYESTIVTNLTCGETTPYTLDTWNLLAATNQMQVVAGVNTGVIVTNVPTAQFLAPAKTATAVFKAVMIQPSAGDSGSVYFGFANLGLLENPLPPTITTVNPNLVTLCTNTALTCTASSGDSTIGSVQITLTTTTLGGNATNTTTYTATSSTSWVTGIGTSTANISFPLTANTIYQSVVVSATDADGLNAISATNIFDTLSPTLVIEAADFNFTSNSISGLFFDTPTNGGLALYTNQIGMQAIDENKNPRTNTQSYYRPQDSTIIQAANPSSPSGVEQKFVTSLANGDTNDIEVAIAYDSNGDWQNYSRTFGTSGTYSAQPGNYNVWCYLATSGSGNQVAFFQVTNNPAAPNQGTNFLGYFGASTFTDNSYTKFVYAPLVDAFGNMVALSVPSGVETFKGQIMGTDTPNVGFYMFVPAVPVLTPEILYVYPTGTFEPTNEFTFTVGPAQGASISTNGIGLIINGIAITSGMSFTQGANGIWTVNYSIQSNELYTAVINVTNTLGLTTSYTGSFNTFNLNNYHWMAVDYDFSTNNDTTSGGSVGDGWTGGLFIDNPVPTGDTNAPSTQNWQFQTNSYFAFPTGFYPAIDQAGLGAVAQQSIDINWIANSNQDTGGLTSNSVYRAGSVINLSTPNNNGDGVGTQIASDSFLLPEFAFAKTNNASQSPDYGICEFNIGYFYAGDWLNYTRTYPAGTFFVWGRLASGDGSFSGCTLSLVTSGVGTSNQTTQVLGSFSDAAASGWQTYHWIQLLDTNGNPVVVTLNGKETLRLTAPTNAGPGAGALNSLFFMLAPGTLPPSAFNITASFVGGNIQISIPTQANHSYSLWYSQTLSSASWSQVGGAINGDGNVHVITPSMSNNTGFYRVIAR
jgi:hypothetical protein